MSRAACTNTQKSATYAPRIMAFKTEKGRLTPEGVAHIRALRAADPQKWTYQALAAEIGICLTTVYNVCKHRTHGKR